MINNSNKLILENSSGQFRDSSMKTAMKSAKSKHNYYRMDQGFLSTLGLLISLAALMLHQARALSLISEKCDPNKVGPDETTVKGGWQAEMFNGLSFRTCGE